MHLKAEESLSFTKILRPMCFADNRAQDDADRKNFSDLTFRSS
jgi:hypothetical protein